MLQPPPVPVILEEYMPVDWLRMVEEMMKKRSPILFRMIIVDINFPEPASR